MYHLKLVWRQILRQKSYLVINTIGLAIALAASILIYTYLMKEWQTDAFHEKRDHIYRITTQSTGDSYWDSEVCSPLGELAKAELPDVLDYTRIITARELKLRWEDSDHYQGGINCGYADRQLFSMFTFPLIAGELREAMQPGWAVISETVARRYFKDENPVGKLLYLENLYTSGKESSFYIAGIMKDFPVRSSIQADVILDFAVIEEMFRYSAGNTIRTFLLLTDHADIHKTEEQLQEIEYREAEYVRERRKEFRLQPLREMYLHSNHIQDYDIPFAQGSGTFNLILSGIVLLILILAFCNYLIMKLAQAHKNAERFAIQKYFGITNRSMLSQILLEIGIYLLGALILTIVLIVILYPYFIQIISPGIHHHDNRKLFHLQLPDSLRAQILIGNHFRIDNGMGQQRPGATHCGKINRSIAHNGLFYRLAPFPLAYHPPESQIQEQGGIFVHTACRGGTRGADGPPFPGRRGAHIINHIAFHVQRQLLSPLQGLAHSLMRRISGRVNSSC